MRRRQHALHTAAGRRQSGGGYQVAGHGLGAQLGQVGCLRRVPAGCAHCHAARQQLAHDGATQGASGADDQNPKRRGVHAQRSQSWPPAAPAPRSVTVDLVSLWLGSKRPRINV